MDLRTRARKQWLLGATFSMDKCTEMGYKVGPRLREFRLLAPAGRGVGGVHPT